MDASHCEDEKPWGGFPRNPGKHTAARDGIAPADGNVANLDNLHAYEYITSPENLMTSKSSPGYHPVYSGISITHRALPGTPVRERAPKTWHQRKGTVRRPKTTEPHTIATTSTGYLD